jgi:quercetin dioxygenase-like cupin family protein
MTEDEFRTAAGDMGYDEPMEKTLEPCHYNDFHAHDVSLFLLITKGEMTLDVDSPDGMITTCCREGDVIEVPAAVTHNERAGADGVTILVSRK